MALDAAFEVNGGTITDSVTGIVGRSWSVGNFGESFVLLVDSDASEWAFGIVPAGMYELADDEWISEESCDECGAEFSQCEHGYLRAMADAIDTVTSDLEGWREYMMRHRVEWFPFGKGDN